MRKPVFDQMVCNTTSHPRDPISRRRVNVIQSASVPEIFQDGLCSSNSNISKNRRKIRPIDLVNDAWGRRSAAMNTRFLLIAGLIAALAPSAGAKPLVTSSEDSLARVCLARQDAPARIVRAYDGALGSAQLTLSQRAELLVEYVALSQNGRSLITTTSATGELGRPL